MRPNSGDRTWTVLDDCYRTVVPVEQWLEANRHLWSPNTVRSYATALAQWWTFLEQRDHAGRWNEVGVSAVTAFLSWLRNDRTVEHAVPPPLAAGPAAATLESRLAAVVSFYTWQEQVFEVPVAGRLLRAPVRRARGRGLLAHLDAHRAPHRSPVVRVRRGGCSRRSPVLLPGEVQSILDTCAAPDPVGGD